MTNRSDPLSDINNLIRKFSKYPLWVFAWGLFGSSLYFIWGVFWDMSEQNGNIAKFNSLAHTYEMDGRKSATLTKVMIRVWGAAVETASYFASNIEASDNIQAIPHDILDHGHRMTVDCREGINAALAVLSTLHFDDQGFNQYVEGFERDLDALDQMLATKEATYKLLEEKKYVEAETELQKSKTEHDYLRERQLNAASLRTSAFQDLAKRKADDYTAELGLQKARLQSYRFKVNSLIFVAGYVGAFTVILIKRLKRALANTEVKRRSSNDSIAEPKKTETDATRA